MLVAGLLLAVLGDVRDAELQQQFQVGGRVELGHRQEPDGAVAGGGVDTRAGGGEVGPQIVDTRHGSHTSPAWRPVVPSRR